MNWKKEAQEKLRMYEPMCQAYRNIPAEIERLEQEVCGPKRAGIEAAPAKGSGGRREEKLLNNIVHRQELQWTWEQTKRWLEVTQRALNCLDQEEKLILHRLCIYPVKGGLERLCKELGVEQSSIYRRRDRALLKFTLALYGTENNYPKILN